MRAPCSRWAAARSTACVAAAAVERDAIAMALDVAADVTALVRARACAAAASRAHASRASMRA
jgi:hypothetical protein